MYMKYGVGGTNSNQNLDLRVYILPPPSLMHNEDPNIISDPSSNDYSKDSEIPFDFNQDEANIAAENSKE